MGINPVPAPNNYLLTLVNSTPQKPGCECEVNDPPTKCSEIYSGICGDDSKYGICT